MSTVYLRPLMIAAVSLIAVFAIAAAQAKPVWYPKTTLYASDGKRLDAFGHAVAIEQDTLAVASGVATYVFERSGSTWVERAKLVPDDREEAGASFGRSVAISGDTIAVTAPTAETNINPGQVNRTGAVYIFTRQGTTWKQQAKLFPPKPKGGFHFGYNLAIDHNTLVVGQDKEAHVFERDSTTATWFYTANLVVPSRPDHKIAGPATYLSSVVSISGNTILVGGNKTQSAGAVGVIFERQPQTRNWAYKQELVFSVPPKILGGTGSVALDRNTLLLGVPLRASFPFIGSAYIAKRSSASDDWQQTAKLAPRYMRRASGLKGLVSDYGFGDKVALKGDYAVVAAVSGQDNFFTSNSEGEVFLFHHQPHSEKWSQLAKLSRHSTKREFLPTVSISNRYVVVGDRTALNPQGDLTGAVHIFELPTTAP
ncbi:FG-GAP repeat protein [Kovacikia minuta CCNUW1]|uniref:FG-GAP repeat protein n=1 Tax=Kovacikia minuta TaxID=2931930 RepID=UPI001CCFB6A6|nr:FG-GAP repeat protein [Kovacikia minuta]UBF27610.1 FG-GAP repeat protein [Kovacikia minuta CCNUW1]